MPPEVLLFDLQDVLVTSRRLSVGQCSFSLRDIRSLQFLEHGRSWRPGAASLTLSGLSGLAAVTTANPLLALPAIGLSMLASVLLVKGAPRYSLGIHTEDGYFMPLVSRDRFLVEGVVKTLQCAAERYGNPLGRHPGAAKALRLPVDSRSQAPAGLGAPLVPNAAQWRSSLGTGLRTGFETGRRRIGSHAGVTTMRQRIHSV